LRVLLLRADEVLHLYQRRISEIQFCIPITLLSDPVAEVNALRVLLLRADEVLHLYQRRISEIQFCIPISLIVHEVNARVNPVI
jgi:hypothetical protein